MTRPALRLAGLALCCSLAGCGLVAFDTELSASGAIPGTLPGEQRLPGAVNASSSLAQTFDSKGIDLDHVESLKITAGRLAVTAQGTFNHLSYIKSFEVYASAAGQPEVRLGHIPAEKFANKPTSIEMQIDDVELRPLLAAGSMTVTPKIELVTSSRPPNAVPISMTLTVHVVPKL